MEKPKQQQCLSAPSYKHGAGSLILSPIPLHCSMQPGGLEKAAPIGGGDPHLENIALAIERQRHVHSGISQGPDAAKEAHEVSYRLASHGKNRIALVKPGTVRGTITGKADNRHLIAGFGGKQTEPGPWWNIGAAECAQIVEDRRQQVDRHDHVQGNDLIAMDLMRNPEGPYAQKVARWTYHRGAAPVRMGGR